MYDNKEPLDTLGSNLEYTALLDTLSDAAIFLDQTATILTANEQAAAIAGTDKYTLSGQSLWLAIPQLITTTFYQAVIHALRAHTSLQIEYHSPITHTWFHAYLSPTSKGIALFFHEEPEPTMSQNFSSLGSGGHLEIAENIPEWITILTPEGVLLEINQQPLAACGLQRAEVIGKPFTQLPAWSTSPVAQEQLRLALAQVNSQGNVVHIETRIYPHPGDSLDMAITLTPHLNAQRQVEYIICSGRDITERKHIEEELRSLVDTIPQLVWVAGPDGHIRYANQRLTSYLGFTFPQREIASWAVHPDDRSPVVEEWLTCVKTGKPYEQEYRMRNGASGEYRWFLVRAMPQRDAQGTIKSWIGTHTDIDDQKRAEERIKASEQNFRILAEAVPHHVWTFLPDGRIDYSNKHYQQYRHLTPDDLGNLWEPQWHRFIHPDDLERVLLRRRHSFETGSLYENEYRLMDTQTGEYHWFLVRGYPMRDDAGLITKWFVTGTDIDEQKRIEEALRQSQRQVQTLMASNIIGIFIAEDEQIFEANDTFLRMMGYSREDLERGQLNWRHMTAPEYQSITEHAYQLLLISEHLPTYEKEYIGKDGSRLPVLVGGATIQQNPLQSICFVLDNSARKALEQRKDTFINMASHELKTPLTVLKMQMQLLKRRLEKQGDHQVAATFLKVEEPIQRLERLISELLDVSKMQASRLELHQEPVDLDQLLHEVATTMQQINATHTIKVCVTQSPTVMGDKGRLEQVLINLLSNAIKFSPNAQTVELSLNATPEAATITVRDYGTGIPHEQQGKIFDRFYRVSGQQQGTIPGLGMGLYIVEEIVKQHQGSITVASEVGKGSTFLVTLPLPAHSPESN